MSDPFDNTQNFSSIDATSSIPESKPLPRIDQEQLIYLGKREKYAKWALEGARWFYWLAALSIINTIIVLLNGNSRFFFGLGVTQIVDAFVYLIAEEINPDAVLIVQIIGLVINLFIAGAAAVIGFLGTKGKKWALIVGLVLYIIDMILCLVFGLYLDLLFHVFVLIFIVRGINALSILNKLTNPAAKQEIPLHSY